MRSVVLASALVAATLAHCPNNGPDGSDAARFVVQARPGQTQDDVARAVRAELGDDARVEPLFAVPGIEDLPDEMARTYQIVAAKRVDESPWDTAATLREAGGFELAQPDLNDTTEPPPVDAIEEATCFTDPGVPAPSDKAWALRTLHVPQAWALTPPTGGRRFGEGVRVCHPDTGWAEHTDLDPDRIDLEAAWNVMDWNEVAEDPLDYHFPLASRGHGTATGSVIMSAGGVAEGSGTTGPGEVTGVAPGATLVPVRSVKSVVQVFDSDVARAVLVSVGAQCDVISMSLGGRGFFGLEDAIEYAVGRGLVVVAAAGNCVGSVVAPASYLDTVAVAATNFVDKPWHGSSHGYAVTLSAPGEDVHRARRNEPDEATTDVGPSDGTSYAAAEVAGAAALWLAYHGRPTIESARQPGEMVQDVFRRAAQAAAPPPDSSWDAQEYGPGILDVAGLLQYDLSTPPPPAAPAAGEADEIGLLARTLGRPRDAVEADLVRRFGEGIRDPEEQRRVLPELSYRAVKQRRALDAFLAEGSARPDAPGVAAPPLDLSDFVRERVRSP